MNPSYSHAGWFRYAYAVLLLALVLIIPMFIYASIQNVRVETRTVRAPAPDTALGASESLGEPQETIPGAQVSPELEGASCGLYAYKDGLALVCR